MCESLNIFGVFYFIIYSKVYSYFVFIYLLRLKTAFFTKFAVIVYTISAVLKFSKINTILFTVYIVNICNICKDRILIVRKFAEAKNKLERNDADNFQARAQPCRMQGAVILPYRKILNSNKGARKGRKQIETKQNKKMAHRANIVLSRYEQYLNKEVVHSFADSTT